MVPVQNCVPAVVAEAVRRQPLTPAKVAFCWRLAVGPAIDRSSRVSVGRPGEVLVEALDAHWRREIERALPTISARLQYLLGEEAARKVRVVAAPREPGSFKKA